MIAEKQIIECKEKIENIIKKFCSQNYNDKYELLDFFNLKLGINVEKIKKIKI